MAYVHHSPFGVKGIFSPYADGLGSTHPLL